MLNAFFDTLPRTRAGRLSREVPAFLACGVSGYYAAVAAALGGALLAGRSLPVAAVVCLTAALSFFAYTYLRRWVTGRETLVLLEHVWFAEACVAAVVGALGEPVLAYLDVVGPALAFFLAAGRAGCLLVGCCHGRPSSVGIVYGEAAARDGFPRHLVGVRLFPVQAVEGAGLVLIGAAGLAALPFAAQGHVFAWFLAAYAVLRFGTEGLRGDPRPHGLGMSVPRWMALAELAAALWIARDPADAALRDGALLGVLLLALAAALAARRAFDPRRALLAPPHVREVREAAAAPAGAGPVLRTTSAGVTVAVSAAAGGGPHVSLSLAGGGRDVEGLCRLAAAALPGADPAGARLSPAGVLHLAVRPGAAADDGPAAARGRADALYGAVARRAQAGEGALWAESPPPVLASGFDAETEAAAAESPPPVRADEPPHAPAPGANVGNGGNGRRPEPAAAGAPGSSRRAYFGG